MMESYRTDWNTLTINELLNKVDIANFQIPEDFSKMKPVNEVWEEKMTVTYGTDLNSAYLGPKLWDKTIPFPLFAEDDFSSIAAPKVQDFHQFIEENALQQGHERPHENYLIPKIPLEISTPTAPNSSLVTIPRPSLIVKRKREEDTNLFNGFPKHDNEFLYKESKRAKLDREKAEKRLRVEDSLEFKSSDIALATVPGQSFDPKERSFDMEELRPQPIIRKRKKTLVPENEKDEQYWEKRVKNTLATKRAREAKRLKENQIALRAAFLEKENKRLKEDLESMKIENSKVSMERDILKKKLVDYEHFMIANFE